MSESKRSMPERVLLKGRLLAFHLSARRIMADWAKAPAMQPTETEIEHARELLRRALAILPAVEENADSLPTLQPQPASD